MNAAAESHLRALQASRDPTYGNDNYGDASADSEAQTEPQTTDNSYLRAYADARDMPADFEGAVVHHNSDGHYDIPDALASEAKHTDASYSYASVSNSAQPYQGAAGNTYSDIDEQHHASRANSAGSAYEVMGSPSQTSDASYEEVQNAAVGLGLADGLYDEADIVLQHGEGGEPSYGVPPEGAVVRTDSEYLDVSNIAPADYATGLLGGSGPIERAESAA
jgi:hypothetical protein